MTHLLDAPTDPAQLEERFSAYVNDGVDDATIAPFNDTWALNALEQVPSMTPSPPELATAIDWDGKKIFGIKIPVDERVKVYQPDSFFVE